MARERDEMLVVRIPGAVKEALARAAAADERTVSTMTIRILRGWLEREGFLKSESAPPRRGKD